MRQNSKRWRKNGNDGGNLRGAGIFTQMKGDPTYDPKLINADPVWRMAFVISECLNNDAPIGWSRYIWVAEAIRSDQVKQAITEDTANEKRRR